MMTMHLYSATSMQMCLIAVKMKDNNKDLIMVLKLITMPLAKRCLKYPLNAAYKVEHTNRHARAGITFVKHKQTNKLSNLL